LAKAAQTSHSQCTTGVGFVRVRREAPMFSACTSAGGRVVSAGLAPCPMQAFDLVSLANDADKLNAKLQTFDHWLWTDCDGDGGKDQFEPTLQIDCVQAMRGSRDHDDADPPLFRGNRMSIENHRINGALNRAALANYTSKVPSLKIDNSNNVAIRSDCSNNQSQQENTPKFRPLIREVPEELDKHKAFWEDHMGSRANLMKENMQKRSSSMQDEFKKGSKKLQAWLMCNNFLSVDTKRKDFFSSTYPIHVAASQNNLEVVQLLILRDANANQLDSKGRTALQIAAKKCKQGSHRKVVAALTAVC